MAYQFENRSSKLNRMQMEEVIRSGGSVIHNGRIYTDADSLPSEADLGEVVAKGLDAHELILLEENGLKNLGVGIHIQACVGDFNAKGHFLENALWLIASYLRGEITRKEGTYASTRVKKLSIAAALIAMEIDAVLQSDAAQTIKENLANNEKRKSQFEAIREEAEKLIDAKIMKAKTPTETVEKIVSAEVAKIKPLTPKDIHYAVRSQIELELKRLKPRGKKPSKTRQRKHR